MSIIFRASSSGNNNSSSPAFSVPAGTPLNDVMVASFSVNSSGSTPTITAPSGWTLILRTDTNYVLVSYYRVANSSEPGSYTWSMSYGTQWAGGIASYMGVDTSTILSGTPQGASATGGSTTLTAPTMTTLHDNALVIASFGVFKSGTSTFSVTPPPGFTERWDQNYGGSNSHLGEMSDKIQATAGSTGTLTATASANAGGNSAQTFALKPGGTDLVMDIGNIREF